MNSFIILSTLVSLLGNPDHGIMFSVKEDFYYLYDKSDSLMMRSENNREIEYLFLHHEGASNAILFIYYKKSNNKPETVSDIASFKVYNRQGVRKIVDEYYEYIGDKSTGKSKIYFFPRWIGAKYNNFYVLEKKGEIYNKYQVSLGEAEIDYILE